MSEQVIALFHETTLGDEQPGTGVYHAADRTTLPVDHRAKE